MIKNRQSCSSHDFRLVEYFAFLRGEDFPHNIDAERDEANDDEGKKEAGGAEVYRPAEREAEDLDEGVPMIEVRRRGWLCGG